MLETSCELAAIEVDHGLSGKSMAKKRPALGRALALIRSGNGRRAGDHGAVAG